MTADNRPAAIETDEAERIAGVKVPAQVNAGRSA